LQDFDIQITIPQNFTLKANPKLLELMLINLLQNATEHANHPLLIIKAENGWLIFENTTDNQSDLDFTQAGIKSHNSSGVGQGLYLVARIIEQFGWQFSITNSNDQFCVKIKPQ
jgi:signal transduction histidine kinase